MLFQTFYKIKNEPANISLINLQRSEKIMTNDLTDLITVEELCDLLMIGRNAAYQLLKSGKIKCFRINRIWKIPRASVTAYIQEQSHFHEKKELGDLPGAVNVLSQIHKSHPCKNQSRIVSASHP